MSPMKPTCTSHRGLWTCEYRISISTSILSTSFEVSISTILSRRSIESGIDDTFAVILSIFRYRYLVFNIDTFELIIIYSFVDRRTSLRPLRSPLLFSRFWRRPLTALFPLTRFSDRFANPLVCSHARLWPRRTHGFSISNCCSPLFTTCSKRLFQ